MLRIGEGAASALSSPRTQSGFSLDSEPVGGASSSILTTAIAAVFTALLVVSAPSLGPMVEARVFAGLSDVGDETGDERIVVAKDAHVRRTIDLAFSEARPNTNAVVAYDSDGSPMATGSVSPRTKAARDAARALADTAGIPARMSRVQGLRGSVGFAERE